MVVKLASPHNIISILSCLLTVGLLVWAAVIGDGLATTAIVLLSTATTLFCAASLWAPPIRPTPYHTTIPDGDVVIRTREGALIVVKCNEDVARELYFGINDIQQLVTKGFGSWVIVGTVVFMVAVILIGNCTWTMQAALAATNLLLNAVFWVAALLPSATHWTFPRYEWEIEKELCTSFTEVLWKAMCFAGKQVGPQGVVLYLQMLRGNGRSGWLRTTWPGET